MGSSNSIEDVLSQLNRLHNNSLQVYQGLSDALTTKNSTISFDVVDEDNIIKKIQIPSFSFLKSQIDRLDNNFNALTSLKNESDVLLSDGTYRRVIVPNTKRQPKSITNLNTPLNFNFKNNWFFENFLSPLLYINVDLPFDNIQKIQTNKLVLNIQNDNQKTFVETNFLNKNDLNFEEVERLLNSNNIGYFVDEDILDIPAYESNLYGQFDVIRIFEEDSNIFVKLSSLNYNDKTRNTLNTEVLKIGDTLILNEDNFSLYQIVDVNINTNTIRLNIIQGYNGYKIGANIFSFLEKSKNSINCQVNIGYNQYLIIFLKPIDVVSNTTTTFYSKGICIFTNSLSINFNGSSYSLDEFYRTQVIDFGQYLLGLAKDSVPLSIRGITPDAPVLSPDNFNVVEINQHQTKRKVFDDIRNLQNEKNKLNSELVELTTAYETKKIAISTKTYLNDSDRNNDTNELLSLESQKKSKTDLFLSVVSKINALTSDIQSITSKYKIRGFIPFPNSKIGSDGSKQEVIGFKVLYRYLSVDGESNPINTTQFRDVNNNVVSGINSDWREYETPFKKRTMNVQTGQFEWKEEDVTSVDSVNVNEIDISISPNEIVEFKVLSISEAGYPLSPLQSQYSNVIRIVFPDELKPNIDITQIREQTLKEENLTNLQNQLSNIGIYKHLSDSTENNQTYYVHRSTNIDSGFLTPELAKINLFEKLTQQDAKIKNLEDIVKNGNATLKFKIIGDDNIAIDLNEENINKIFAGYYSELTSSLNVKKGVIITQNYKLQIINESSIPVDIKSIVPGAYNENNEFIYNDLIGIEKYNKVPLLNYKKSIFNQSPQFKGQFIYFRYAGLLGEDDKLYKETISTNHYDYEYNATSFVNDTLIDNSSIGFIKMWDNTNQVKNVLPTNLSNLNEYDILIHKNHPFLTTDKSPFNNFNDYIEKSRLYFNNSKLATLDVSSNNVDKNKQWEHLNQPLKIKYSFRAEDQFLLGKGSCGCYLFPLVRDFDDIRVSGNTINSKKAITNQNIINIPIVFQFRMTDYWGNDDTQIGHIAGDYEGLTENVKYSKRIGFDVLTNDRTYRIDLEFLASYKRDGLI